MKRLLASTLTALIIATNLVPVSALTVDTTTKVDNANSVYQTADGWTPGKTEMNLNVVDGGNLLIATVPLEMTIEVDTWGRVVAPTLTIENNTDDKTIKVYSATMTYPRKDGPISNVYGISNLTEEDLQELSYKYMYIGSVVGDKTYDFEDTANTINGDPDDTLYRMINTTLSQNYASCSFEEGVAIQPEQSTNIDFNIKFSKGAYVTPNSGIDLGSLYFIIGE